MTPGTRLRARKPWPVVVAAAVLGLASCATAAPPSGLALRTRTVPGMVYDQQHQPVSGALLLSGGEVLAVSGADGRFLLPHLGRGAEVDVRAEGMWPVSFRLGRSASDEVLYVRLVTMRPDLELAAQLIAVSELRDANRIVQSMVSAQSEWPPALVLQLQIHLARNETGPALETLLLLSSLMPDSAELSRLRKEIGLP